MDFKSHALILSVIEHLQEQGSWTGKTHVQKALSLMKVRGVVDVPFRYLLYKHGPYSFEVESALEQMRSFGAVAIEPNRDGYGVVIRADEMCEYVQKRAELSSEEQAEVERACEFIGQRNVSELERLATAAWIRGQEGKTSTEDVAERLHRLKPHVSVESAREADREVSTFLTQA